MLADALQRDINTNPPPKDAAELTHILVWLRYRHGKWLARQSVARALKAGRTRKPPAETQQ